MQLTSVTKTQSLGQESGNQIAADHNAIDWDTIEGCDESLITDTGDPKV